MLPHSDDRLEYVVVGSDACGKFGCKVGNLDIYNAPDLHELLGDVSNELQLGNFSRSPPLRIDVASLGYGSP